MSFNAWLSAYIVVGFLFIFLLYILKPRGYRWGQLRGYNEGENDATNVREMAHQDVASARREVLVATCAADLALWGEETFRLIREKAERKGRKQGVTFIFLVGPRSLPLPHLPSLLSEAASRSPNIVVRTLSSDPPMNFRIVDRFRTYAANSFTAQASRFFRTFGNGVAVEKRLQMFEDLDIQAREISW